MTVIGSRPQFVKAAVVSREIQKQPEKIEEVVVHSGQHYDTYMTDIFFSELEIPTPKYHLEVGSAPHGEMSARILTRLEPVLLKESPNLVLVYGDTNSTMAAALCAAKLNIPLAHVEAGLRSFNTKMPEELNRIIADRLSQLLFCPTETALQNLKNEGIGTETDSIKTLHVGDVMYDASLFYRQKASPSENLKKLVDSFENKFLLATVHRAENTDDKIRLGSIFSALGEMSSEEPVVMPLHPRTKKYLSEFEIPTANICIIEPVGFFDMIYLLQNCTAVLTDSGGLQKEAFWFKKPCVTLRDETEWVELVEIGVNLLVGASKYKIIEACTSFAKRPFGNKPELFGDGQAGGKIVAEIVKNLCYND